MSRRMLPNPSLVTLSKPTCLERTATLSGSILFHVETPNTMKPGGLSIPHLLGRLDPVSMMFYKKFMDERMLIVEVMSQARL